MEFFERLRAGLAQLMQLLPPLFFALVILVAAASTCISLRMLQLPSG